MIAEAATARTVREVAEEMRPRDREEFMAASPFERHTDLVEALVERYSPHPDVYAFLDGQEPIAIAGLIQHRPRVVTLLFFSKPDLARIGADLTRFVAQRLFPAYQQRGVHRIECASIESYGETHRWLKTLGLKQEAIMPGYGRDGQTYIQFAWVSDVRPVSTAI